MRKSTSVLLCLLLLGIKCYGEEDPTTIDFCSRDFKHCKKGVGDVDKGHHPACNCKYLSARTETYVNDSAMLTKFRQMVLDKHNQLRNDFAGGKERARGFNYSSDMSALNYDLTLEYFARCRARSTLYKKVHVPHEPCRKMPDGSSYGQNLLGSSDVMDLEEKRRLIESLWFDEVKDVKNMSRIDHFDLSGIPHEHHIGHFTELIWSRTTHLGCVYVYMPDSVDFKSKSALLCDYHGPRTPGNVKGQYVYKRVNSIDETCTACYLNKKCDKSSKYPYLCGGGEIQPAPNDKPYIKDGCSERSASKMIVIVIIFIIVGFY